MDKLVKSFLPAGIHVIGYFKKFKNNAMDSFSFAMDSYIIKFPGVSRIRVPASPRVPEVHTN